MRKFVTIIKSICLLACFTGSAFSTYAQMEFVENKGQWNSAVQYKGDFKTGAFFLENKGFTVVMNKPSDVQRLSAFMHGHDHPLEAGTGQKTGVLTDTIVVQSFAYKVKFLGAAANPLRKPDKALPTYNNYFLGSDASKWANDCKVFQAVTFENIYPNIDIRYYSDGGVLKYDFVVKPGGNPNYIAMQYEGPDKVSVKDKELIIETPVGVVKELYPYTYQSPLGKKQEVGCRFVVKNNVVTFKVDDFDPSSTLIIDPSIIFSSFTGSTADNWGYTATPGPDGSFFAGGIAFSSGFRVSPGAFQTAYGGGVDEGGIGGYDMAIFKFSASGSSRLYATYIGGSANEQPHSMIADAQGNLVIAGRSNSANYPRTTPLQGPGGSYDIVITKLNAAGTGLIGSVKIGGSGDDGVNIRSKYPFTNPSAISLRRNYGDDARSEVILDNNNNIILVSCTQSGNIPIVNAVQPTFGGGAQDGYILKMNANLSSIQFATYFGGSENDACFVTSISPITGDLYVGGATASNNLLGLQAGVIDNTFNGGDADGFITQLRNDGSAIIRTAYQGTSGEDLVYGLKFDRAGFPYIMGTTTGNWTVQNAAFSDVYPGGVNAKQFISKLRPDLSAYVYSTVFGTNSSVPNISPVAFLVDRCENVYVSGWGGGINVQQMYTTGNTSGLASVNPLPGIPPADGKDFYFFVMERNATSQLFGSHFGQNGGLGDHADGGTSRFDENGIIYQAVCANCTGGAVFPTTPGVWSSTNGSTNCNLAAIKIEMNFAGVSAAVQASINSVRNDSVGCVPLRVDFTDTLFKGKTFYWNFGDGSLEQITTTGNISHLFTSIGVYRVRMIAEDSSTCNIRDTAYINIRVGDNEVVPNFTIAKIPPCASLTMQFTNTTTNAGGTAFRPRTFVWDYGDGTPRDTASFSPPRLHTYASAGTYLVSLYVIDTNFCNAPDTITQEIRLNPLVRAQFNTSGTGCAPYEAVFENTSLAGTNFIWDFGDGTTSNEVNPTHLYFNPGTYNVRLIAIDSSTCNISDTSGIFTIQVFSKPTAFFNWAPNPPIENTPVRFTNLSIGASRYLWNFGDGSSSILSNPVHQYETTGTFNPELIAYNDANCTDTFNLDVNVIILPVLDVPNAFTPGQAGINSIIKVEGFGIGKMNWRIYNRWGQMVFESTSKSIGWNGTFKGKLQPMDVYTYTLDVEFTDGKKLRKTGDITLLR